MIAHTQLASGYLAKKQRSLSSQYNFRPTQKGRGANEKNKSFIRQVILMEFFSGKIEKMRIMTFAESIMWVPKSKTEKG
jgi:hypothetical protein